MHPGHDGARACILDVTLAHWLRSSIIEIWCLIKSLSCQPVTMVRDTLGSWVICIQPHLGTFRTTTSRDIVEFVVETSGRMCPKRFFLKKFIYLITFVYVCEGLGRYVLAMTHIRGQLAGVSSSLSIV